MKILVCGGRDYKDRAKVYSTLEEIHTLTPITKVIDGGAKGADQFAYDWSTSKGKDFWDKGLCWHISYPAEWDIYGKKAGPIRNKQMLEEGKPDMVIAFPGGKGTAHMVKIAKEANIPVKIIEDKEKLSNGV